MTKTPAHPHPTATAPGATWQLLLMGRFELSDGVQRHTRLPSRPAMALLARLALQPGTAHPREALADLLWPDAPGDASRQRLRQALSTLKQALEPPDQAHAPVLDADRHSLRLLPGRLHCDAVAFEAAFKSGDHDRARALYAGELLPGFYDEWISDERLRLEGLFDRLRPPAAPPAAEALAPAAPSGPQRSPLPAYLTRLIGADPQAARLREQVAAHRLVTLMGPGGAGKTRMSVEVAQAVAGEGGFEMVVFVPLATCRTRQQLLDQLLMSLQLPEGPTGAVATLVQALDGRRALLVLDNFEQVVDEGADVVAELGARLPLLHQLVSSRRALALPGEHEVVVAALPLPATDAALAEAALNPAMALFVDRARASRAEFQLHEGNVAAVIALVQLLEGMPLAIELAAARVRSMAPADMAATLQQARQRPVGTVGPDAGTLALLARAPQRGRQDTRHHSMEETIAWSWQLLDDHLRTLLAALTVFQGGFTSAAAAAVCAGGPAQVQAHDMPHKLDELLSHSLLRTQADGDSLRFGLYEPVREFAQRTLTPDAAAALRQRHRAWARAWAQAMPVTPSLPALHAEMPNLVAAMAGAVADGAPQGVIELALALVPTLEEVSLPGAAVAALQAAVTACDDVALKSRALTVLGRLLFLSGHGAESLRLVEQGLALAPADQPALRSRALLLAAHAAMNSGQRGAPVLALLDQAQALSEAENDTAALARIASCRADVVRAQDPARAEALQRGALAVWEARGDRIGVMRVRYSLAILAYRARRFQAMHDEIDPVVAEARQMQAWVRLSTSLNARGTALKGLRRWEEAAADIRTSVQMAWQALSPLEMVHAMSTLLALMVRTGRPEAALQLAGFLSVYWPQRFGPMKADEQAEQRQVRRMARRLLGPARSDAAFAAGQQLTAAQAVALAATPPREATA